MYNSFVHHSNQGEEKREEGKAWSVVQADQMKTLLRTCEFYGIVLVCNTETNLYRQLFYGGQVIISNISRNSEYQQ